MPATASTPLGGIRHNCRQSCCLGRSGLRVYASTRSRPGRSSLQSPAGGPGRRDCRVLYRQPRSIARSAAVARRCLTIDPGIIWAAMPVPVRWPRELQKSLPAPGAIQSCCGPWGYRVVLWLRRVPISFGGRVPKRHDVRTGRGRYQRSPRLVSVSGSNPK